MGEEAQVNVDTGQFQALTERVDALERKFEALMKVEDVMRRAGMPDELRAVAERESARETRHLRAVK